MKSLEKETIIARLGMKDYNKELEKILQQKHFSKLCNNLLLSMLYKIENSYDDYKKVKIDVPQKKEYMEELFYIIKNDCNKITIVKPNEQEIKEDNNVLTSPTEIVAYENELVLLNKLFKLNDGVFDCFSTDEIRSTAISKILSSGEISFKCEVLRDFDGWSWNTNLNEIDDYISRLYYQILVFLLGYEFINNNKKANLKMLCDTIREKLKPALAEKTIKVLNQLAIMEYLKAEEKTKEDIEYLKNKKEGLKNEIELMADKRAYIEEITKEKKQKIKQIEEIDKYINDDLELKKEYIKQNEQLPREKRVFSLSDFSEIVQEKRKRLEEEIGILTQKIKPNSFVKVKSELEKNYKYICELDLEKLDDSIFVCELIECFLKYVEDEIKTYTTKKEIIDMIYILRYLSLFNIDDKTTINMAYKKQMDKTEKKLITAGCNLKVLTIFSQDIEENFKIYKNIFQTRIIDLENVFIEITKENMVKIYDENTIENEEEFKLFNDLIVRKNKKIKIFL